MSKVQCPLCCGPLEVRDVTPCFICGGWPGTAEQLDPAAVFREYRLPNESTLVLCHGCELEEFMVPGGWGERLGLPRRPLPINVLQLVRDFEAPWRGKDKYCPACNLRLVFLNLIDRSRTGTNETSQSRYGLDDDSDKVQGETA